VVLHCGGECRITVWARAQRASVRIVRQRCLDFPVRAEATIPQHTDFDLTNPSRSAHAPLNWSAERDEQEDFELKHSGGFRRSGMIVQADGVTQERPQTSTNFTPLANANRNQLKVRGVGGGMHQSVCAVRDTPFPFCTIPKTDRRLLQEGLCSRRPTANRGHGGPQWTTARIRYTPPPRRWPW